MSSAAPAPDRPRVTDDSPTQPQVRAVPDWLDLVARHVAGTDYGVVQITVHGSRVVQVDWTQRARFASGETARREE